MRITSRQASNYTRYDGQSRLSGLPDYPIVMARGKTLGCTFVITDDGVVHMQLHPDGMKSVLEHNWGSAITPVGDDDIYISYGRRAGFQWYQIPYVNLANLPFVVLQCKEIAHLNIRGRARKPRKGDPK